MFSGCPSVRPSVRPYEISLTPFNLKNPLVDLISSYLAKTGGLIHDEYDELIRILGEIRPRSKVNEIGLNMLGFHLVNAKSQEPLTVDFHQTWYRGATPGVDELSPRFWARSAATSKSQ